MSRKCPIAERAFRTLLFSAVLAVGAGGATSSNAWAQEEGEEGLEPTETPEATTDEGTQAEQAAEQAPATTPSSAPASDIEAEVRRVMDNMPKLFEFHGYFRSGYGYNSKLTRQVPFQAQGAPNKYRLGNETDEYGELIFVNNWMNPEADGAWFKTEVLVTFANGAQANNFDNGNTTVVVREAFAQAGGVWKAMPSAKFWAGQKFYQRHDIHINDFYFWDMSGRGGGVEDIDLGFGKLSVSLLAGSQGGAGTATQSSLDIRLADIPLAGGGLTLWVNPTHTHFEENGADAETGVAVGLMHTKGGFMGGFNKAMLQFGYGQAAGFHTFFRNDLFDGWVVRATEQAQIQPSPNLSLMAAAVVQFANPDEVAAAYIESDTTLWVSAGVRPVYHLSKYWSMAGEVGFDFTQGDFTQDTVDNETSGFLAKLTVAPQIAPGNFFWARPVIRAYVTAAFWGDDFQGAVGAPVYADDTFGLAFGVQMESWW